MHCLRVGRGNVGGASLRARSQKNDPASSRAQNNTQSSSRQCAQTQSGNWHAVPVDQGMHFMPVPDGRCRGNLHWMAEFLVGSSPPSPLEDYVPTELWEAVEEHGHQKALPLIARTRTWPGPRKGPRVPFPPNIADSSEIAVL